MKFFLKNSLYLQPIVEKSLKAVFGEYENTENPAEADLQWAEYEDVDFDTALRSKQQWISAYCIRKALIRKHYLINTLREYVAKHPESVLGHAVPHAHILEVDYAEFLDDALDEAFELRGELELNEDKPGHERKWFILKPGMAEGGAGIHLFSTIVDLITIFEQNEEDAEGSGDVEEAPGVMTSDMRFYIAQEYIARPLLLSALQSRKFHIRAYVLCIGSLNVYIHRDSLLMLCAGSSYDAPSDGAVNLWKHLTNTCYQTAQHGSKDIVHAFWVLRDAAFDQSAIYEQLKAVVRDLFSAAIAQRINFQTLPNAFEIYGLDFLVDEESRVHLLEVNAYPDFAQTGPALQGLIDSLILDTCHVLKQYMQGLKDDQRDTGAYEACLTQQVLS